MFNADLKWKKKILQAVNVENKKQADISTPDAIVYKIPILI